MGVSVGSRNNIGPEGAKALAAALTPNAEGVFNTSLSTLNLKGTRIGPEEAKALAVALTPNAEGVLNGSLSTLNLADNKLCGVTHNAHAFVSEGTFGKEGRYDASGIEALADALAFNRSLNTLDVCGNYITGEAAELLAEAVLKHPSMRVFNKIIMQEIRDDKRAELDLSQEEVDVSGAVVLSKLFVFHGSLNTLAITAGVDLPIGNELTNLDLGGKQLRYEDVIILGAALLLNRSLSFLDLSDNQLCVKPLAGGFGYINDTSGIRALADALAFNTSLNTLNLCIMQYYVSTSRWDTQ
eukprot:gene11193-biopygen11483